MRWSKLAKPIAILALLSGVFAVAYSLRGTMALSSDQVSGQAEFSAGIWGVSPTPTPTPNANNCTYTMGYWKNHPEAWPVEEITIGGVTFAKAAAIVILETEPGGDATYILAHQLIAAKLNVLKGADPGAVTTTITDADNWLGEHLLGSDPSNPDRAQGIALADTLDEYNNGVIDPGHCDGEITTSMPELAEEPAEDPTTTPTPNNAPTPVATPTATPMPAEDPTPAHTPAPPSPTAGPTGPVCPVLEGVVDNGDGSYTAFFGYESENGVVVTVPIGLDNKFTPGLEDRGQPTTFQPGRTPCWPNALFSVVFDGSDLVWTLSGRTATVSSNSTPCAYHLFVEKQWYDAEGNLLSDPPASVPPGFTITAQSALGIATCNYPLGSSDLVCEYVNSQSPALDDNGLWVPVGTTYTVVESGLPEGWTWVAGTGEFTAGDGYCVSSGDGFCTHTVKNHSAPTPEPEPTATPTLVPTEEPTAEPSATPTLVPTEEPTAEPSATPTLLPTEEPMTEPTATPMPTEEPTAEPTAMPTLVPTEEPTTEPTATPTPEPTEEPTPEPTPSP